MWGKQAVVFSYPCNDHYLVPIHKWHLWAAALARTGIDPPWTDPAYTFRDMSRKCVKGNPRQWSITVSSNKIKP